MSKKRYILSPRKLLFGKNGFPCGKCGKMFRHYQINHMPYNVDKTMLCDECFRKWAKIHGELFRGRRSISIRKLSETYSKFVGNNKEKVEFT